MQVLITTKNHTPASKASRRVYWNMSEKISPTGKQSQLGVCDSLTLFATNQNYFCSQPWDWTENLLWVLLRKKVWLKKFFGPCPSGPGLQALEIQLGPANSVILHGIESYNRDILYDQ